MRERLLLRRYGYGAAKVRLSIPPHPPRAEHRWRDALALACREIAAAGWRTTLARAATQSAVVLTMVFLSVASVWLALLSAGPEENERTEILLVRAEPPPPVAEPEPEPHETPPEPEPEPRPTPAPSRRVSIDPVTVPAPPEQRLAAISAPRLDTPRAPASPFPVKPVASRPTLALDTPAIGFRRAPELPERDVFGARHEPELEVPDVAARAPVVRLPAAPVRVPTVLSEKRAGFLPDAVRVPVSPAVMSGVQGGVQGVPLEALAACRTEAEEDSLKQQVISAAEMHETCRSEMGTYRFLQMRNVNGFLLWVQSSPGRKARDRCGELRLALSCLETQTPLKAEET